MSFAYQRRYCGPIRAVVLDWAGTTIDFGCMAPAAVFRAAFASRGVPVSFEEARRPMGMEKRAHIATMLAEPGLAERWQAVHGTPAGEAEIDQLFQAFIPLQLKILANHVDLIPGLLDTVAALRARGIRIGTNTGYSREMMAIVTPLAAEAGYEPDVLVCPEEARAGRPTPYLAWRVLEALDIHPAEAAVKVDDTVAGVEEGLNAGLWSVGVALSGNETGLNAADLAALAPAERARRRAAAARRLAGAGAHYVIDSIADLMPVIAAIEQRLRAGERP